MMDTFGTKTKKTKPSKMMDKMMSSVVFEKKNSKMMDRLIYNTVLPTGTREMKLCSPHTQTGRISA